VPTRHPGGEVAGGRTRTLIHTIPCRVVDGRALVVDGAGRVLLFECRMSERPGGAGWFTPGGGVADGESLAEAAVRELGEETGPVISPDQLGPRVAATEGYAELGWVNGWLRDDFVLCRVDPHEVETSGFGRYERASVIGHRWWTASELAETDETVYPIGVGAARRRAGRGPAAAEPVWHC
jgi:8-oxo-dGTP pyrophosphatase MutT (NUDIX family)